MNDALMAMSKLLSRSPDWYVDDIYKFLNEIWLSHPASTLRLYRKRSKIRDLWAYKIYWYGCIDQACLTTERIYEALDDIYEEYR